MKTRVVLANTAAAVLIWAFVPALAEQADQEARPTQVLAQELAEVNRSLGRIARTLEELLAHQRLDLVVKRIELAERRLDPLEQELRRARNEVRSIEEDVIRMESMAEQAAREIDELLAAGLPPDPARETQRQIDAELKRQQDRLAGAERRVREREDELAAGREEIEILDERLRELLEDG